MAVTRRMFNFALMMTAWSARPSRAQSSTIMVSGTSREFDDILRHEIDDMMRRQFLTEVLHDTLLPRNELFPDGDHGFGRVTDVLCLDEFDMALIAQRGALEDIRSTDLPRVRAVEPSLRRRNSVVSMQSPLAIVYNSEHLSRFPLSLHDLWSNAYRGRIGLAESQTFANGIYAAMAEQTGTTDLAAAGTRFARWRELDAKIFPTDMAIASALSRGEIWLTIAPVAHAFAWKKMGAKVAHVIPQEGTFALRLEAAVPRAATNKVRAFEYLNLMLERSSQAHFASAAGYAPTVRDIDLDAGMAAEIKIDTQLESRLWQFDPAALAGQRATLGDLWKKIFRT